jgi:hypothetical protein
MVGATAAGTLTVKLKETVLVSPPAAPVIVTVETPAGVAPLVLIVRVVEHVGLQEAEDREAVTPVGSPDTLKLTA